MAAVEADFPEVRLPTTGQGDPLAWYRYDEATARSIWSAWRGSTATPPRRSPCSTTIASSASDAFPAYDHVPGPQAGRSSQRALTKPIGVVKGISDVPWHKDCSLGRHSYECCSLTVGISVTGADAELGPAARRARVPPRAGVAGSLCPAGARPRGVDLPTRTGDVTVHLSCTQHMSQPPVTRTRKVLYTGFGQRPVGSRGWRRSIASGSTTVRSKTHTSISQEPGYLGD